MDANISVVKVYCGEKASWEILEKAVSFTEDALAYRNYFITLTVSTVHQLFLLSSITVVYTTAIAYGVGESAKLLLYMD